MLSRTFRHIQRIFLGHVDEQVCTVEKPRDPNGLNKSHLQYFIVCLGSVSNVKQLWCEYI